MKLLGDYIKSRRGVLLFFALAAALLGVRADGRTFFAAVCAGGATAVLWRAIGSPLAVTGATVGTLANFLTFSLGARRCRRGRQELRLRLRQPLPGNYDEKSSA